MGTRYILYRVRHELEKRIGLLERRFPSQNVLEKYFGPKQILNSIPFFLDSATLPKQSPSESLRSAMEHLLNGDVRMFSAKWESLGLDYNWITNPETGYEYPLIHWSKIPDYDKSKGDIKFVWEKSRFSWFLTVIRYDHHFKEDHSKLIFESIDSWIHANPINRGPNYRCSQEMSLRLWNWAFALHYYKSSPHFTEQRWKKYQNVIYWHLHHIYHHIDFSRIAVRNNHAITETSMLMVSQWLFPFIPETKKWSRKGEKWFSEEVNYQIYDDGTFLQFSMNYHRVAVQVLTATLSIAHLNKGKLTSQVYEKAYKSVNFLYQCMGNLESGELPNYGQNDGAWFFPLTDTEYRDFRPMLNSLHRLLTGEALFDDARIEEEWRWFGSPSDSQFTPIELQFGIVKFEEGGYYLIRESDTLTFFRNGNHKDRPSQADNQHLDVWVKGENVLLDSGTYKYNTEDSDIQYFMGNKGHNVIQIGENDQMKKGGRFIWYYWTQSKSVTSSLERNQYTLEGTISAYRHLSRKGQLTRCVEKVKNENRWIVRDELSEDLPANFIQRWHTSSPERVIIQSDLSTETKQEVGYTSTFYGQKTENSLIEIHSRSRSVTTEITVK